MTTRNGLTHGATLQSFKTILEGRAKVFIDRVIEDHKNSIESKDDEAQRLRDQLNLKDTEIKKLKEENKDLGNQWQVSLEEIEQLQHENSKTAHELTTAEARLEKAIQDVEINRTMVVEQESIIQELRDEARERENKLKIEERKNKQLIDEKSKLEVREYELQGQFKAKEEELSLELSIRAQEIKRLHKDIEQKKNELQLVEGNLSRVTIQKNELQMETEALKVITKKLEEERNASKEKSSLHTKLLAATERQYEQRIQQLEQELEQAERASQDAQTAGLQEKNKAVKYLQKGQLYKMETHNLQQAVEQLRIEAEAKDTKFRRLMEEKRNDLSAVEEDLRIQRRILRDMQEKFKEVQHEFHSSVDKVIKDLLGQKPKKVTTPDRTTLSKLAIRPKEIVDTRQTLGIGAWGIVKVLLIDGKPTVAKIIQPILMGEGNFSNVPEHDKKEVYRKFERECLLLHKASGHENIVKFAGVIIGTRPHDLKLLMEKVDSDLYCYLQEKCPKPLATKLSILHDITCGLVHLHETCFIVHKDLNLRNILLTSHKRAKIADFGLSNLLDSRTTKHFGAPAFMPYKRMFNQEPLDTSLDVFSFGCIMLYLGVEKYEDIENPADNTPDIQRRGVILAVMEHKQPEFSKLVRWCLDDCHKRPSSTTLKIILEVMKRTCQSRPVVI